MNTPEELNNQIALLKKQVENLETSRRTIDNELSQAKAKLEDVGKPIITEETLALIEESIESAIDDFDFNDTEYYDVGFEIDYNNHLSIDNIEFNNHSDLSVRVFREISSIFNVIEETN